MAKKCEFQSLPEANLERRRNLSFDFSYPEFSVPKYLAEYAKGKKFFIYTFGCQANVRDEEIMAGYLELAGYAKAASGEEADLVIINTCAVRENAEEKVYGEIGKYKASYARDKSFVLAVCGCMMQERDEVETIKNKYPHVKLIFGTHNIDEFEKLIDKVLLDNERVV